MTEKELISFFKDIEKSSISKATNKLVKQRGNQRAEAFRKLVIEDSVKSTIIVLEEYHKRLNEIQE